MKALGILVVITLLIFVANLATVITFSSGSHHNEHVALTTMKVFSTAETDFWANDRDGNGAKDYWTSDVAGLCLICPPDGGRRRSLSWQDAIKLIDISLASADADFGGNDIRYPKSTHMQLGTPFTVFQAKDGYHYARLLRDSASDYAIGDSKRYGFAGFAEIPGIGELIFITNQDSLVFRRVLPGDFHAALENVGTSKPTTVQIVKSGSTSFDRRFFPADPGKEDWMKMD